MGNGSQNEFGGISQNSFGRSSRADLVDCSPYTARFFSPSRNCFPSSQAWVVFKEPLGFVTYTYRVTSDGLRSAIAIGPSRVHTDGIDGGRDTLFSVATHARERFIRNTTDSMNVL
jgi:hypothetical protein